MWCYILIQQGKRKMNVSALCNNILRKKYLDRYISYKCLLNAFLFIQEDLKTSIFWISQEGGSQNDDSGNKCPIPPPPPRITTLIIFIFIYSLYTAKRRTTQYNLQYPYFKIQYIYRYLNTVLFIIIITCAQSHRPYTDA